MQASLLANELLLLSSIDITVPDIFFLACEDIDDIDELLEEELESPPLLISNSYLLKTFLCLG